MPRIDENVAVVRRFWDDLYAHRSVQVLSEGRIAIWRDYSNIDTLLSAAPAWWLEHVTSRWGEAP